MDSTTYLEEEQDSLERAKGVWSADTQLRYYILKAFHLV